jgi:hypothetical protein
LKKIIKEPCLKELIEYHGFNWMKHWA